MPALLALFFLFSIEAFEPFRHLPQTLVDGIVDRTLRTTAILLPLACRYSRKYLNALVYGSG
jgi:hypothetical protein